MSLLLAAPALARATEQTGPPPGALGVGVLVGSPTGLSAKFKLDKHNSFDAAFGFGAFIGPHAHADWLYEGDELAREEGGTLSWFVGVGGRLEIYDDNGGRNRRDDLDLGARFPVGLEIKFDDVPPLEVFVEAALTIEIMDDPLHVFADLGIGARWFF